MARGIKYHRYDLTKLGGQKETYIIKRLPFWKRWFCEHQHKYIGIDNVRKVYACSKCGAMEVV